MKKTVIKNVCISILTVVIIFGIYLYLGMVLTPKGFDDMGGLKYYSATSYKYEEKNTVDVMLYGNSDLYAGVSPMEMYGDAGITAFGCGAGRQTMRAIARQVKKTFKKYQKPKVVVLEVDCMYYSNVKGGGSTVYEAMTFLAPLHYHARWKDLKWRDFVRRPVLKGKDNYLKGYYFSKEIRSYEVGDNYMKDVDAAPATISKSVVNDFDKVYKLCKKNNAELLLFATPSVSTWSHAKNRGVQELVDAYNEKDENYQINFLDLNLGLEGFDYETSYYDRGNHCNYFGMKVVTNKLCEYLQENYEMTDRRGDDKYKNWDKCLEKYQKYIKKQMPEI